MASIWGVPPSPQNYDYFDYLEQVGQLGGWDYVDIIAIHPYRPNAPEGSLEGRGEPLDLRDELHRLDYMLLTYGAKPIWITEIGWTSANVWPGVDLDTQAFYLIRTYALSLTHPSIEKVFWYDLRNDTDPAAPYHQPVYHESNVQFHFGMLNRTYPLDPAQPDLRKPAFLAYRTLTEMLGGLAIQQMIADGDDPNHPGVYWYRFGNSNGDRRVDLIWRNGDFPPTDLYVDCGCREALVRAWNGEVKSLIYTDNGTITLNLGLHGAPVYVQYDPPVQPGGQMFEMTGHTLRGAFLHYWQNNDGLRRFGYPITEELIEPQFGTGLPRVVQYFDRVRFEHFPEYSGSNSEIYLGRLGETMLQRQGIDWHSLPKSTSAPEDCLLFEATGRSLCPPFRNAWEQSGAITFLGYPITEPIEMETETGKARLVQYFERARLEYFPEHRGTPNEIQLGLLGREYLTTWSSLSLR
ncbi:MAG: hypothetical protein HC837_07795 [Chloroflexaceae bacterium]|nr:hypothetical protein [Chloroflexaceae bacterium]